MRVLVTRAAGFIGSHVRVHLLQRGDVEQTFADITRLHDDFGFAPEVSLTYGLKSFIDWYRNYAPSAPVER